MDLKQLRALTTVAETGNVTRAATLLNIVQPALSRQLRLLEEDLGVTLFERGRRGMELTASGRQMLEHARRILDQVAKARAEVTPSAGSVSGIVSLGLLASTAELLSSTLVAAVRKLHPGIRLRLLAGYDGQLLEWLENGTVDAALLYEQTPASTTVRRLLEAQLWAVAPASAGLAIDRPLRVETVAAQPFIFPSAPHRVRTLTEQAAARRGLAFQVVAETNSVDVQKQLVAAGLGWTILPAVAVSTEVERGSLSAAPLADTTFSRRVVLANSGHQPPTEALQCVIGVLVDCMRSAVQEGRWAGARWLQ